MKKIVSLLVLVFIFNTGFINNSNASAYKACSKRSEGQIKNDFKCSKTGSVYRWIPVNNKTQNVENKKTELEQNNNTTSYAKDLDLIKNNARQQILLNINLSSKESFNSKYYFAPTISDNIAKETTNRINVAYLYWKNIFIPTNTHIIIWDTNSKQWADSVYEELKGGLWNQGHKVSASAKDEYQCNNAFSSNFYNNLGPKYIIVSCDNNLYFDLSKFKMAHEYTHWVQDGLGLIQNNSPIWLVEGSAHFYGQSIGFNNDQTLINKNRKNLLDSYDYNKNKKFNSLLSFINNSTDNEFISYMKTLETRYSSDYDLQASYLIGSIATEYLIGKYGEAKLISFWKEYKNSSNTDDNFKKVYNITSSEFYKDLKKYTKYCLGDIK